MNNDTPSRWHQSAPDKNALPRGIVPPEATLVGSNVVPLRVFLRYAAWESIQKLFTKDEEHVGVLLGRVYKDGEGPFIVIQDAWPAPHTRQTPGGTVFSNASWDALEHRASTTYSRASVIGSFRVRPGGGTGLSPYDRYSAERFFPEWHQLLYVVDPHRQRQGMFHWRQGELQSLPGFWVFNEEAAGAADGMMAMATPPTVPSTEPRIRRRSPSLFVLLLVLMLLLPWACVGALPGSLPAMRRQIDGAADAQQQMVAEVHALQKEYDLLMRTLDGLEQTTSEAPTRNVDSDAPFVANAVVSGGAVGSETTGPTNREDVDDLAGSAPSSKTSPPDPSPQVVESRGFSIEGTEDRYVIRQGDTLWAISHQLFGDPYAYLKLAEGNDITDPDLILPGWELRLPTGTSETGASP